MLLCGVVAAAYWLFTSGQVVFPKPDPAPAPAVTGVASLLPYAGKMGRSERQALSQAYDLLAGGIRADESQEPVFGRVEQIRNGHRAALLMVWSALGNEPGKYPGLAEELDKLLSDVVGVSDVVVTPAIRQSTANLFSDISGTFK